MNAIHDDAARRARRAIRAAAWLMLLGALFAGPACAGEVSGYLPLNLEPRLEGDVERMMILADRPVMTRPIALVAIERALPDACRADEALCLRVQRELAPWLGRAALGMASGELAIAKAGTGESARLTEPNARGEPLDAAWQVAAQAYARSGDHVQLNLGGVAYPGRAQPTGTFLSFGGGRAQIDVGFRDHWWSPLRDSSMLQSTEAPTLPTVTLSNSVPLTRFRFHYEVFGGRLSRSDRIEFENGFTSGYPLIAGYFVSMEPVTGWTISGARIEQFGGGQRRVSLGQLFRVFYSSASSEEVGTNNEFGNQQVSISSQFIVPGAHPIALSVEYAAEDTFHSENYRFGNGALSAGFYLPKLTENLQLRYEFSNWEDAWYVNHLYGDGLTNDGRVLGNWGADWRRPGDIVGAQSHMLQLGWDRDNGAHYDLRYRTVQNAAYTNGNYHRAHELQLSATGPWHRSDLGLSVQGGVDPYGKGFGRLAATLWITGNASNGTLTTRFADPDTDSGAERYADQPAAATTAKVERFVDVGIFSGTLRYEQDVYEVPTRTTHEQGAHIGIGARRSFGQHSDIGMRLEADDLQSHTVLELRALDYRYRIGDHIALTAFFGFARYDVRSPAHGYYLGGGAQWRNVMPGWDLNVELHDLDRIVRKKDLAGESIIVWPNEYWSMPAGVVSVSRRF